MKSGSRDGILVISEHVILKDTAYRERVWRQIAGLKSSGSVHLVVFGVGTRDDIKMLKSRLRPVGIESVSLFFSRGTALLKYPGFLLKTLRARSVIKRMCKRGRVRRVLVENLLAYLPLIGTRVGKRCTVVLDYHGVVPEEVKSRRGLILGFFIYLLLKRLERLVLKRAHGVICVSYPFKDHLTRELSYPEKRILVYPNLLKPGFRPGTESRDYFRKLYGLDEKFVLVYSGSLMPHQCPGAMARMFKGIRARLHEAYLLIFTHDQQGLKRFLEEYGPFHGDLTYMRIEYEDMPSYLSMGDMGLLLREANLINRVASPTKFPEYLACGIPVIISEKVGTASELVHRMGLGVVVDIERIEDEIEKTVEFISYCQSNMEEIRKQCMKAASDLTVSKDDEKLIDFYRALEDGDDS